MLPLPPLLMAMLAVSAVTYAGALLRDMPILPRELICRYAMRYYADVTRYAAVIVFDAACFLCCRRQVISLCRYGALSPQRRGYMPILFADAATLPICCICWHAPASARRRRDMRVYALRYGERALRARRRCVMLWRALRARVVTPRSLHLFTY